VSAAAEATVSDVVPIRTLPPRAAEVEVGDRIACNGPGALHLVRHKSWSGGNHDTWVSLVCSCGQRFSGALRP
jgi:chitodextrinase